MNKNTIRLLYMLVSAVVFGSYLVAIAFFIRQLRSLRATICRCCCLRVDAAGRLPSSWSSSAYGCGRGGATYTLAARFARDGNYRREPVER
jgi:hypothetical protein